MNNLKQSNSFPIDMPKPVWARALMQKDRIDTQQWQRYIEQEIGFVLPDIQLQWLINAIDHTASSYGLTTESLWNQLPSNSDMRQQLLDKVLIHESRFFRHRPSVDFVVKCALKHQKRQMVSDTDSDNGYQAQFRIWSVGCASGQETWSLAMSLASAQLTNYAILGTDVSQQAVSQAQLGQYDKRQQDLIPQRCQQFVQPLPENNVVNEPSSYNSLTSKPETRDCWEVASILRPHVDFTLHNIIEQKPPTSHLQHVIICQNMLLYFRKFDQRDILARLSEQCVMGGYIVLAPGEALFWRPSNMRRIAHPQVNVWQKTNA